jgi:hypothetical protein
MFAHYLLQRNRRLMVRSWCRPTYYLRSKHQVVDKLNARATGVTMSLTRQPPEGRARGGSSRIGEMVRKGFAFSNLRNSIVTPFFAKAKKGRAP